MSMTKMEKAAIEAHLKLQDEGGLSYFNLFKAGAEWQYEQFEKERLKHCDELTAEQAQIESDFVVQHLENNRRTPTFLDTLEVEEADLEKEFDKYIEPITAQDIKDEPFTQLFACAQYFFELGLKARANKELVEEVYSHLDSIEDTADRMTSGNFMHSRAAIKFSANTIVEVLELMGIKAQKGK